MSLLVTRFAPSPTGHLHIGGARTALFCWAFAKKNAGHFLLRIEDTDQARSSDESARGIMEDLAWLGIDWDEGPELARPSGAGAIGGDPRGVKPFFQARRVGIYNAYIEHLVRTGHAYPAFETAEVLEAKRKAAVAAKQTYRYDRAAAREFPTPQARLSAMKDADAARTPYVVRFYMPDEDIIVDDLVLGRVQYKHGEGGIDDFVIRKADGFPTYHFAVVIDDELMGITHVMRAQEHLNNTPRHVALQKSLTRLPEHGGGPFRIPNFSHLPLIFNMDGTKMSKRDKAKTARAGLQAWLKKGHTEPEAADLLSLPVEDVRGFLAKDNDSLDTAERIAMRLTIALPEIEVSDFREAGYIPEAIVNFLGLLGWNPGMKLSDGKDLEKFDRAFLSQHFAIDRIGTTNAKFDRQKLLSFNGDYLNAMSPEQFADRWQHWLLHEQPEAHRGQPERIAAVLRDPVRRVWLASAVKQRTKIFRDAIAAAAFLVRPDDSQSFDAAAVDKALLVGDRAGYGLLSMFNDRIKPLHQWTPEIIHATMESLAREKGYVTEKGVNLGPLAAAIRVAIAGVGVTPPLGETIAVLGRESTLARIDQCLRHASAR